MALGNSKFEGVDIVIVDTQVFKAATQLWHICSITPLYYATGKHKKEFPDQPRYFCIRITTAKLTGATAGPTENYIIYT